MEYSCLLVEGLKILDVGNFALKLEDCTFFSNAS